MNKKLRLLISFFIACFVLGSVSAQELPESIGTLHLVIAGIRSSEAGILIVVLYNSKEHWLKRNKEFKVVSVEVTKDTEEVVVQSLPYADSYALFVFHDANKNEKLDFKIFPTPRPKEGIAVSNNAVRFGKPLYEKARFRLDSQSVDMKIDMHY